MNIVVQESGNVDADTISEGGELKNGGSASKAEKRDPVILYRFVMVDVTRIAEPIRNPGEYEDDCSECEGYRPASQYGKPKELSPWLDLPAYLEMQE